MTRLIRNINGHKARDFARKGALTDERWAELVELMKGSPEKSKELNTPPSFNSEGQLPPSSETPEASSRKESR